MIPRTDLILQTKNPQTQDWQQALKDVVRDPAELFELLQLNTADMPARLQACKDFALKVPRGFIAKMRPGDWQDPLLLQVLPQGRELSQEPGFIADPLQEAASNPQQGLIHKYHGRLLLIVSGGCAINCRYCFRRHFPYEDNNPSRQQWQQTIGYIRNDSSIKEVILSGGDPLVASDKQLAELIAQIEAIPHVSTLRIHSRLPLVIPERITDNFTALLAQSRLKTVFVTHCNHPNEIDEQVTAALARLKQAGCTLLNQAVLLAGINDKIEILQALSMQLFEAGVLPYYLHLLDKVQGAAHFNVDETTAKQLLRDIQLQLPGYLVPRLVREQPNAGSKTLI